MAKHIITTSTNIMMQLLIFQLYFRSLGRTVCDQCAVGNTVAFVCIRQYRIF